MIKNSLSDRRTTQDEEVLIQILKRGIGEGDRFLLLCITNFFTTPRAASRGHKDRTTELLEELLIVLAAFLALLPHKNLTRVLFLALFLALLSADDASCMSFLSLSISPFRESALPP